MANATVNVHPSTTSSGITRTTLGAAAQTISATIVGTPARVRLTGFLRCASGFNATFLINGASTNITQMSRSLGGADANSTTLCFTMGTNTNGIFVMDMWITPSASFERIGVGTFGGSSTSLHSASWGLRYADTSTAITSITLETAVADSIAAGSTLDIEHFA